MSKKECMMGQIFVAFSEYLNFIDLKKYLPVQQSHHMHIGKNRHMGPL